MTSVRPASILAFACVLGAMPSMAADCPAWNGFHPPALLVSSATDRVLVADLDGDGAPEILASGNQLDEHSAFSVFRNLGHGRFAGEQLVTTGFGEELRAVGDLNGDGIPDLVAADYWSNGIVTYLGRGALAYGAQTPHPTATHGGPSLVADVDGDGIPDVLSFSFGSGNPVRVHVFHGNGDGTFAPKTTFETGRANAIDPSMRAIPGGIEIVAAERLGQVGVYRYVDGKLTVSDVPADPGIDLTSTFADVNGDGIADIVSANDTNGAPGEAIFVMLGNVNGTFGAAKPLAQQRHAVIPFALQTGDFDRDGHLDLVVADFQSATLYVYRGDGAGGFAQAQAVDAGGPVQSLAVSDVDGDGWLDIVTANNDHTISVILNGGGCLPARHRAAHH